MLASATLYLTAVVTSTLSALPPNVGHPRNVLWFGGPRGGEPDSYHYDLIYDDQTACKGDLKTPTIRHFILMGSIIDAASAEDSQECAQRCYENEQCASANYYVTPKALAGQCELLMERQSDNPTWMLPMPGAMYMEVFCEEFEHGDVEGLFTGNSTEAVTLPSPKPLTASKSNFLKDLVRKLKYLNRA